MRAILNHTSRPGLLVTAFRANQQVGEVFATVVATSPAASRSVRKWGAAGTLEGLANRERMITALRSTATLRHRPHNRRNCRSFAGKRCDDVRDGGFCIDPSAPGSRVVYFISVVASLISLVIRRSSRFVWDHPSLSVRRSCWRFDSFVVCIRYSGRAQPSYMKDIGFSAFM